LDIRTSELLTTDHVTQKPPDEDAHNGHLARGLYGRGCVGGNNILDRTARDAHARTDHDAFIARLIISDDDDDFDDCAVGRGWLADKNGEERREKEK